MLNALVGGIQMMRFWQFVLLGFGFPQRASCSSSALRTLVSNGDAADLFDITFLAEGYTAAEEDAFFADASRLVKEVRSHASLADGRCIVYIHS